MRHFGVDHKPGEKWVVWMDVHSMVSNHRFEGMVKQFHKKGKSLGPVCGFGLGPH